MRSNKPINANWQARFLLGLAEPAEFTKLRRFLLTLPIALLAALAGLKNC